LRIKQKRGKKKKLSTRQITKSIDLHYKKVRRAFGDDQFQLQELQTKSSCFLVCSAMVQVMINLWSLFIESLGSYSRCRMSNGVMPCVLGPTNFYLKIWVNILIKRWTSKCCCVIDDLHLGSSCMNEHMNFGRVICFSYEFMGNNQSVDFTSYIRKLLSRICLGTGVGEIKWIMYLHAHALRDCVVLVLYQLPCVSISDWAGQICFAFAFHLLYYS